MKKVNYNSVLVIVMAVLSWKGMAFGFAGGDGSAGNPWQISNATHLQAVNNDLSAHYILINDISLGSYTHAVIAPYLDASSPHFKGSFDGNGHVIRNLTVNGVDSHYGLFGLCDSGSEIKNLYMENISINGWLYVGCLVGYNNGSITNCHVVGNIYGPSNVYTDVDLVGGLVGYNSSFGNITHCSSAGTITCPLRSMYNNNEYVGGLVGYNYYGSVTNCHSTMNITASAFGGDNVGGLIGQNNHGTIISCYASGNVTGDAFVGGLIGQNVSGNISLCYSTGTVTGIAETYGGVNYAEYIGGLIGINTGNINNSYSTGNVLGDSYIGGLVGKNHYGGLITNCYSSGNVGDPFISTYYIGGLVGYNRDAGSVISYCYTISHTYGDQLDSNYIGSLVGYNEDSTITSCFWNGETSGQIIGFTTNAPELVTDVFEKTTAEMQTQSTFTDYGWDFLGETANGTEDIWEMIDYPKLDWENDLQGIGTSELPYLIKDFEDFQEFCKKEKYWERGVHTRLDCDLDLNPTLPGRIIYTQSPIAPDTDNLTRGFQGTDYKGYFNGNGHVISNLTIARPNEDYVGLFGYLRSGGQIMNLGLENIDITGLHYVGGLVGYNWGAITGCYVTGTVSGSGFVGGLVGSGGGTITACYATGSVTGTVEVGGLMGVNYSGTISACYATGTVSGGYDGVGLVGGANGSTINASFWDIETSGQTRSAGGKGLTTAQMKTMSVFQNADWADKGWVMNDGVDYPRLDWENTGGVPIPLPQAIPLAGSGTEEDPYLVSTAQEFALLSWYFDVLDKHIQLTENLDLSGVTLDPIGDLGPFTGVFDGNGCTVSNAVIFQPNSGYVGLFSTLGSGGQIMNLGAENIDIAGENFVGGLLGSNYGTISACYATGTVSGFGSYVGGLVGHNSGSITSSYATGEVNGYLDVGGLVGYNYGRITACYATGSVTGALDVGGLVGANSGIITASFWDIETSGLSTSGGGIGKTTAEMQTQSTFTSAGWDFVGETANGTDDIWMMRTYPALSWEDKIGTSGTTAIALAEGRQGTIVFEVYNPSYEDNNWLLDGFESCAWITSVSPVSGSSENPTFITAVTVHIDTAGLSVGDYTCPLTLLTDNGDTALVSITLSVYKPVNLEEFALLASYWSMSGCESGQPCAAADWFVDGTIDILDLMQLAKSWLSEDIIIGYPISDHVFEIEMSLSYDFGEGYTSSEPQVYEFDAWMWVDETVVAGNLETPTGEIFTAEFEYDDDEIWLGVGMWSTSLAGLADFTDGEYIFTVVYANGTSQSTTIPFAAADGTPLTVPPRPLLTTPVHNSTNVPLSVTFELDPSNMTNPVWTYGLEYFPASGSGLEGKFDDLPSTTTTVGPVNLSPNTQYEIELTANHAIWSTNDEGIPYVVDKDSEVEMHFTTGSE